MRLRRTVAVAFIAAAALAAPARGEVLRCQFIDGVDAFLRGQMEWFDSARPPGQAPLVQSFGWHGALPFPPDNLNPPPSVNPPAAPPAPAELYYRGDVYDQSLAACWFAERARLDFVHGRSASENLGRAQQLLGALLFLADHDPVADGRLRAAYYANNLLNPAGTQSSIMSPTAAVGNMSYAGIAMTRFVHVAQMAGYLDAAGRQVYLDAAKRTADWILAHCRSDAGPGGFTGGLQDWNQTPITWKSTEHNLDAWVLARNLMALDGDPRWTDMADQASGFVQAMYVAVDDRTGYYRTGTLADGVTPNPSPIPADAQAWTALSRWDALGIDTDERARAALRWMLDHLPGGCESGQLPDVGIRFSDVGKNMQSEVTAGAALALLWLDEQADRGRQLVGLLDWVRLHAARPDDGITDSTGVAATPCPEGAFTGFGNDWYYPLLHVASSVWSGAACLYMDGDEMANPLRPIEPLGALADWPWTYQNAPSTTADRHACLVTLIVAREAAPGESYTVTFAENGGAGLANFTAQQTGRLTWKLVGGRIGLSTPNAPGRSTIAVRCTGQTSGQVSTTVFHLTLRKLGDINGDGLVNAVDKLSFNKRLNLIGPWCSDRPYDLTGDGLVNAMDKLAMNRALNGQDIP